MIASIDTSLIDWSRAQFALTAFFIFCYLFNKIRVLIFVYYLDN